MIDEKSNFLEITKGHCEFDNWSQIMLCCNGSVKNTFSQFFLGQRLETMRIKSRSHVMCSNRLCTSMHHTLLTDDVHVLMQ